MFKSILVPVSGSNSDPAVFATALALAKPFEGHLHFLHIHQSPGEAAAHAPHVDFCEGAAIATALEALRERGNALAAAAERHYRDFCETRSIPVRETPSASGISASWSVETRRPAAQLLFHARHSDLAVLGRQRNRDYLPGDLVERLLLGSGRPVVIAPETPPADIAGTVVIGWKETPEAARAVAAAMPLLERARRVVLVSVMEEGAGAIDGLNDLARQLAWHGIVADVHVVADGARPAQVRLLEVAESQRAAMLVVGGFGHGPFRERMFGGVTQAVIEGASVPVFLVH
jgi:nucleotide-binding universal stress UspA family protein